MKNYGTFLLLLAVAQIQAQIDQGLLAHYTFTSNELDSAGANHGQIVGQVSLTEDRKGNSNCAYAFPGTSNDYIQIDYSSDFDIQPDGAMTISLWYNGGTQDVGDLEFIFVKENDNGQAAPANTDYHMGLYDGNSPSFGSNYSPIVFAWFFPDFPDPDWHHVVGTYENKIWKIYHDNQFVEQDSGNYQIFSSTGSIAIGKKFEGKADDIRLYNRALSANEVSDLYNLPCHCNIPTSKDKVDQNIGFSLFPNPSTGFVRLRSNNAKEIEVVRIYGIQGNLIEEKEVPGETWELPVLSKGVYLVEVEMENTLQTQKLVIE